jgi:hypothetical protein
VNDAPHSRLWGDRRPVTQCVAGDARWAGHPGSPGAGRAKLRLSRGFQRCLAYDVTPQKQIVLASVFDRERHASFEALWAEGESPPRNQSFPFPFCRVPPSGLSRGRPSHTKLLISSGGVKIIEIERDAGFTLSGEATREAPAQAELRPTWAGAPPSVP